MLLLVVVDELLLESLLALDLLLSGTVVVDLEVHVRKQFVNEILAQNLSQLLQVFWLGFVLVLL